PGVVPVEHPRLDEQLLAAAPSSAGVPTRVTPPGRGAPPSNRGARARNAPSEDAAITLCPQPCPTPGSASYSAVIATCGPEVRVPSWAVNAVGMPPEIGRAHV